jgi:hypothetical protein
VRGDEALTVFASAAGVARARRAVASPMGIVARFILEGVSPQVLGFAVQKTRRPLPRRTRTHTRSEPTTLVTRVALDEGELTPDQSIS